MIVNLYKEANAARSAQNPEACSPPCPPSTEVKTGRASLQRLPDDGRLLPLEYEKLPGLAMALVAGEGDVDQHRQRLNEARVVTRLSHAMLACAMLLALNSVEANAPQPKSFELLSKPHVAMLCALHMTNLAVQAQREPLGSVDERVDHSARFFNLALTWLPEAAAVSAAEQERLAHFVVASPVKDIMHQGTFCADEAVARLKNSAPAQRAENSRRGFRQAIALALVIASGG